MDNAQLPIRKLDESSPDSTSQTPPKSENGTTPKSGKPAGQKKMSSAAAKDPNRPRRKKARRACYACQRAHLTCGDERPCQRCIKRGLQDQCQDGQRKRAKYLHDAPPDALSIPPPTAISQQDGKTKSHRDSNGGIRPDSAQVESNQKITFDMSPPSSDIYGRSMSSVTFPNFAQQSNENDFLNNANLANSDYNDAQRMGSFAMPSTPLHTLIQAIEQTNNEPLVMNSMFGQPFYGSDFQFDTTSFDFGNHYGALEFGMLGHIAGGIADTPPSDTNNHQQNAFTTMPGAFGDFMPQPQTYLDGSDIGLNQWQAVNTPKLANVNPSTSTERQVSRIDTNTKKLQSGFPFAIGIESHADSPASDDSHPRAFRTEDVPGLRVSHATPAPESTENFSLPSPEMSKKPGPQFSALANKTFALPRRTRNPSAIYDAITEPYSYTSAFHNLTAFIRKRFSSTATIKIAKALSAIRPSFISVNKTLVQADLVFMEQCFQRTLWEYEDFISACGTPTIVCRRTGEVVAVGREFSILTGWTKEILLGKEANLNTNAGSAKNASQSGTATASRTQASTPRIPTIEQLNPRPQPVFLAELLDDDSVVDFYEDFARLAYGDPRGSVTKRCTLLKYRTKEDELLAQADSDILTANAAGQGSGKRGSTSNGVHTSSNELERFENTKAEAWKVECAYTWTLKRDLFDLPMMIVMNFLPCYDKWRP